MAAQPHSSPPEEWIIRPTPAAAAEEFCAQLAGRLERRRQTGGGPLTVALTGGHSAHTFYPSMAAHFGAHGGAGTAGRWRPEEFLFFWSDERLVPPGHPDSNYRLALETLLQPAAIPPSQVHRVPAEAADAPARYAATVRRLVPPGPDGIPRFDVLILGLGEDGHTASLFPHTDLWQDDAALVRRAAATAEHPHDRATFTPRLLNAAAEVWFLLVGESKAAVAARLRARRQPAEEMPALVVEPARTRLLHFLDAAAAGQLSAPARS